MIDEAIVSSKLMMLCAIMVCLGPLRLCDEIGLDICLAVGRSFQSVLPMQDVPQCLQTLVDEQRLGKKSGRGFYIYPSKIGFCLRACKMNTTVFKLDLKLYC